MSLRDTPIVVIFIISAAVLIGQCTGQPTLMCDNFCSNNVVTCTCEETENPSNTTVWKLSTSATSCSISLKQTGACNATSGMCATFPGIMAVNDPPLMDGASCLTSTLSIPKTNSLEGLQINCMSPNGISYGGIGFSTAKPLPPTVIICKSTLTTGFLIAHSSGGIPTSYNVTISTGGRTIKDTVPALSNGTATYSFAYTGSDTPTASVTAINCAGNAISNAPLTFPPCSASLTVEVNGLMLFAAMVLATIVDFYI
ncbi:hypothetical protein EMCRGX_G015690 [Ephydatia muelleri]